MLKGTKTNNRSAQDSKCPDDRFWQHSSLVSVAPPHHCNLHVLKLCGCHVLEFGKHDHCSWPKYQKNVKRPAINEDPQVVYSLRMRHPARHPNELVLKEQDVWWPKCQRNTGAVHDGARWAQVFCFTIVVRRPLVTDAFGNLVVAPLLVCQALRQAFCAQISYKYG